MEDHFITAMEVRDSINLLRVRLETLETMATGLGRSWGM